LLIVNHPRDAIERILICTGGLDVSDITITGGAYIAQAIKAQVTVLHVVKPVPSMYAGLQEVEETLPEMLQSDTPFSQHLIHSAETLTRFQLDAKLEIRHGMVDREILRESQVGDYDLIVMGAKKTKGPFQEWFLGDITNEVIAHAPCPVLVLSNEGLVQE
jgi:nucleotide-binding universal stress UspA family protein